MAMTPPSKRIAPADVQAGLNLRAWRKNRGMSQTALGERLGITYQQIQKYEKGTNRLSVSRLADAAEALNVPLSTLLAGTAPDGIANPAETVLSTDETRLLAEYRAMVPSARTLLMELAWHLSVRATP